MGRVISTAIAFIDGFTKPSKEVINSMKRMGNEAIKAGKQIQNAGKTITKAGSSLTKSITLPLAGVATAAIKMGNDFEDAMAKVSTIADTVAVPMNELKNQVIDLSNTVGVGVTDIAEAQYQAISAGIDTANSVDFVGTAIKAAKGGFTDATTAVDGLTTVLNAYGKKASEATNISDQMLVAQNFGKTSFGDMASTMGQVIPIASSLNVATEDLFSSVAVLTKNGIQTSSAMTGLKAAYSNILKPTSDAAKTAKQLGLDFSASHLQSVGWAQFLTEIKEKTGGSADAMSKLFGSTEALNAVTVLAGKGSEDFATAMKMMKESTGATQAAYEKMITPSERMNISINKIKNSLLKVGAALTPVFNKVANMLDKVGDRLAGLSDQQVNSMVKFAGIAAAVGPALIGFGKVVTVVGKAKSTFGMITKTIANFGGIVGMITSPAGIVIGVLAGIALAAVLIIKNWDKVKPVIMKIGDWFKQTFEKAGVSVDTFKKAFSAIGNTLHIIFGMVGKALQGFGANIREGIGNTFQRVAPIIQNVFAKAITAIPPIIEKLNTVLKKVIPIIGAGIQKASQIAKVAFDTIRSAIQKVAPIIKDVLSKAISGAIKIFKEISVVIKQVAPVIKQVFIATINQAIPVIKAIVDTIKKMIPVIGKMLSSAIKLVQPVIKTFYNLIKKLIPIIGNSLKNALKIVIPVVKSVGSIFKSIFSIIGTVVTQVIKNVTKTFDKMRQPITTVCKVIKSVVVVAFQYIDSVIKGVSSSIGQYIDGIKKVFSGISDFISGVFTGNWKKAWQGIKDIFGGVFESLVALCKMPINTVISLINKAISGINKLSISIPDWVPGLGGKTFGIDIPTIPMLYRGTDNWKGGAAMIHDRGAEVVDLPSGSRVYPHDKSLNLAKAEGAKAAGRSVNITIPKLAEQIIVKSESDIDKMADRITERIASRLIKVSENMEVVY